MAVVKEDSKPHLRSTKNVVKEEQFTKALTSIIRRDFFPDVAKLEKDLSRVDSGLLVGGNSTGVHRGTTSVRTESGRDTATGMEGAPGAVGGATEIGVPSGSELPLEQRGLDQYLSSHESEDDASFKEVLEKARQEHRLRHAWLHQREQQYSALAAPATTLAITQGPAHTTPIEKSSGAVLDSWTYTAKNSLMYVPEGVEKSAAEVMKEAGKSREIIHDNTRLSRQFMKNLEQITTPSSQIKPVSAREKIGVDGRAEAEEDNPRVLGYDFVATPQIQPGVDASPLMTWGSIEGTPQRLDSDLTPSSGPTFKLPKESVREKVALKLADEVAKATRARKKATLVSASPGMLRGHLGASPSNSQRLCLLSPAARRLVSQRCGRHGDKALTASYTPRSARTSRSSTPSLISTSRRTTPQTTPHLSDNLLKLKDRP